MIGPRRTRLVSQILSAVIGAGFAIYVQFQAILSCDSMPTVTVSGRDGVGALPALCRVGLPVSGQRRDRHPSPTLVGLLFWAASWRWRPPRAWSRRALAGSLWRPAMRTAPAASPDRAAAMRGGYVPPRRRRALRHKEWTLLLRDPWLLSQTLMQLLYLLPAAFILWRNFRRGGMIGLLVPILIVTAGQLGGGLAWLAVSGEDAPDLIASAPVHRVARAARQGRGGSAGHRVDFHAVRGGGGAEEPGGGFGHVRRRGHRGRQRHGDSVLVPVPGGAAMFRRRQTASRLATFAEALSSTGWAGAGALAATGSWMAVMPGDDRRHDRGGRLDDQPVAGTCGRLKPPSAIFGNETHCSTRRTSMSDFGVSASVRNHPVDQPRARSARYFPGSGYGPAASPKSLLIPRYPP